MSSPEAHPTTTAALVPRGHHAGQRVLRAALAVLAEHGYAGFTMQAVAHRANASKATLYRRWPTRVALLAAAMELSSQPPPTPDTGSLRSDLHVLVRALHDQLHQPPFPQLMAAFVDAAEREPQLAALHQQLTQNRRRPLHDVLTAAARCGQIPPDTDIELAIDLLAGPLFYRRLITHQPPPASYSASLVDHLLASLHRPT